MDDNSNKDENVIKLPTYTVPVVTEDNSFGKWLDRNGLDLTVYAVTALLLGGAVWLAYAAVKEEIAEQEAFAEAAKKHIKIVTDAYSRGARVLAGPSNSTWIVEGDKVELIY